MRTKNTRCVHRIRLKSDNPQSQVQVLLVVNLEVSQRNPAMDRSDGSLTLFSLNSPFFVKTSYHCVYNAQHEQRSSSCNCHLLYSFVTTPPKLKLAAKLALLAPIAVAAAQRLRKNLNQRKTKWSSHRLPSVLRVVHKIFVLETVLMTRCLVKPYRISENQPKNLSKLFKWNKFSRLRQNQLTNSLPYATQQNSYSYTLIKTSELGSNQWDYRTVKSLLL